MSTQNYNGWSNYETWCVSLWLSNNQGSSEFWRRETQRIATEAPEANQVKTNTWTVHEAARFNLAELIAAHTEEDNPLQEASLYRDLLRAAVDAVNWDEIAADLLEQAFPSCKSESTSTAATQPVAMEESATTFRFSLGRVVSTPGAIAELSLDEITAALNRHERGDWGLVGDDDARENELALQEGFRLLSAYDSVRGKRFWIITEADRSVTTILLPAEY